MDKLTPAERAAHKRAVMVPRFTADERPRRDERIMIRLEAQEKEVLGYIAEALRIRAPNGGSGVSELIRRMIDFAMTHDEDIIAVVQGRTPPSVIEAERRRKPLPKPL